MWFLKISILPPQKGLEITGVGGGGGGGGGGYFLEPHNRVMYGTGLQNPKLTEMPSKGSRTFKKLPMNTFNAVRCI